MAINQYLNNNQSLADLLDELIDQPSPTITSRATGLTGEEKMTRAEQMMQEFETQKKTWNQLLIEANEVGKAYDQDFERELTYFQLSDESLIFFNGKDREIATPERTL